MLSPLKKREVEFKSPFTPKAWLTACLGSILLNLLGLFAMILHPFLHFSKTRKLWSSKATFTNVFLLLSIIITITMSDLETQKRNGSKSTNHKNSLQPMTFWMCGRKLLFPERSIKMIDGSKECKCQLASELQDLCVFEKHSKEEVTQSKNGTEDKIEFVSIWFCQMGHSYERKKIQFTTTNTFYFFVISHMHPCVHSATVHHVWK